MSHYEHPSSNVSLICSVVFAYVHGCLRNLTAYLIDRIDNNLKALICK